MTKTTISLKPGTTAYSKPRKRLRAWLMEHNAHGLSYELHWLEDGDQPEINEWIRAPWLDEPEGNEGMAKVETVTITVTLPASCRHGLDSYDRQLIQDACIKAYQHKED